MAQPDGPTERYTTLAGEVVEYPRPDAPTAQFLGRVVRAAADPGVTSGQLIELIYSRENPILDQTIFPGRGAVTKVVFQNPLYHVMLDLLGQKQIQHGELDLERAHARYTLTASEAAERLGITPSAVRQAIAAKRLAAIKKGGTYFLNPVSVDSFRVVPRGPRASRAG